MTTTTPRQTSVLRLWVINHAIVVGSIGAAVLLIIVYMVVSPYRVDLEQLSAYRVDLSTHQETLNQQKKDWKAFADSLSGMSASDVNLVADSIPAQPSVPELFVQLEQLTEQNDFRILAISLHDAVAVADTDDVIMSLPITMKVVGPSYEAFQRLLGSIQDHIRLFDVNAIYFAPETDEYTIDFVTYYLAS